jgi:hypothetical protein
MTTGINELQHDAASRCAECLMLDVACCIVMPSVLTPRKRSSLFSLGVSDDEEKEFFNVRHLLEAKRLHGLRHLGRHALGAAPVALRNLGKRGHQAEGVVRVITPVAEEHLSSVRFNFFDVITPVLPIEIELEQAPFLVFVYFFLI